MIDRKYKPLLTILNIFIKSEYLPSIKDTNHTKELFKSQEKYAVILVLVIGIVFSMVFVLNHEEKAIPQKR